MNGSVRVDAVVGRGVGAVVFAGVFAGVFASARLRRTLCERDRSTHKRRDRDERYDYPTCSQHAFTSTGAPSQLTMSLSHPALADVVDRMSSESSRAVKVLALNCAR